MMAAMLMLMFWLQLQGRTWFPRPTDAGDFERLDNNDNNESNNSSDNRLCLKGDEETDKEECDKSDGGS